MKRAQAAALVVYDLHFFLALALVAFLEGRRREGALTMITFVFGARRRRLTSTTLSTIFDFVTKKLPLENLQNQILTTNHVRL